MLGSIALGLIAALIVSAPAALRRLVELGWSETQWSAPAFVLALTVVAMGIQRLVLDRAPSGRTYDGVPDLFVHIHSPSTPDSWVRWSLRALLSFLLTLFGGMAGPEGAAVEAGQSLALRARSRTARWFEHRRRTDAASALAAGISAAFGAPLTGVLLATELGIGGRGVSVAMASLSAFIGARYLTGSAAIEGFEAGAALHAFRFASLGEWAGALAIGAAAGLVSAPIVRLIRCLQDTLLDFFKTRASLRMLAGGILLFAVAMIHRSGLQPPWRLLESVFWLQRGTEEVALLFVTQLLALALTLSAFGTIGVFWPILALGGCFGFVVNQVVLTPLSGFPAGFSAVAALAGGAAFWGAVLGAPLAAGALALELTQNFHVLLPCLLAGFTARGARRLLRTGTLIDAGLDARGMALLEGRTESILKAVLVSEAMVTDHESVREHEPVGELHTRLLKSRYAFLPVVNDAGQYLGLITTDMVQEAWRAEIGARDLLEAKDLLYRSRRGTPSTVATDRLTATAGLFDRYPCIPVVDGDRRLAGLLFSHNVRLAYDREVSRRALSASARELSR